MLRWAKKIIPLLTNSTTEAVDYELNIIPDCYYYRLQLDQLKATEAAMDNVDPKNISNLQTATQAYLESESTIAKLNKLCKILDEGRGFDMPGIGQPFKEITNEIFF